MRVLVAGIGNVGKSTLCETIAQEHPSNTVFIDMDYHRGELPENNRRVVIVEDVHGLESDLTMYGHIIYLLPPPNHALLWFRRAWAWFSTGIVDLPKRRGNGRPFSIRNLPLIFRIVGRNLWNRKKWVSEDLASISRLGPTAAAVSYDRAAAILREVLKSAEPIQHP